MQLESRVLLEDIRRASDLIVTFTAGRSQDDYARDVMLRSAVERQFEIIGEALRRLARADPTTMAGISNHKQIVAFRNVLAHGYDAVVDAVVWDIVQDSLPALQADVAALLREPDDAT